MEALRGKRENKYLVIQFDFWKKFCLWKFCQVEQEAQLDPIF